MKEGLYRITCYREQCGTAATVYVKDPHRYKHYCKACYAPRKLIQDGRVTLKAERVPERYGVYDDETR